MKEFLQNLPKKFANYIREKFSISGISESIFKKVPKKFLHITEGISWNKSSKKITAGIPAVIVEEIVKNPKERLMELPNQFMEGNLEKPDE